MKKLTDIAVILVLINTVLSALHHYAHQKIDLYWTIEGNSLALALIVAGPLVAAVLLWIERERAGAIAFLGTVSAALVFSIYVRFFQRPPAMPPEQLSTAWRMIYHAAFVLLVLTQAAGTWLGFRMIQAVNAAKSEPRL